MATKVGLPEDDFFGFCFNKNLYSDRVKLCWTAKNLSGKTINYYTVTLYFYNAVGDPAYDSITDLSYKTITYVGPVKPSDILIIYGDVGYIPVCSKIVIGEITLDYSDGTYDTGWYGYCTSNRNSAID